MKIKLVQDSIVFISGLKKEELEDANRFCKGALTLKVKDEASKKETPICMVAYAAEGSVSENGIVFDSTTDDGYMCKTIVATQGLDQHNSAEDKIKAVSECFAGLILKMNDLEDQIKSSLEDSAAKIATARESIEAITL